MNLLIITHMDVKSLTKRTEHTVNCCVFQTFAGFVIQKVSKNNFSKKIIDWYQSHKRDLPWRETRDPYKIWLSEIILQQTRVAQGLPYYLKFVENFPDVISLADAKEDRVLRLWQGLGYYSRARNLHACAKKIKNEYDGVFPNTFAELMKLPGIGSYTAAAIASIAFAEPVAVVDGNVFRVLARVFGIDKDISANDSKTYFFEKAIELIDKNQPDLFNQAVMEFGAMHCTPQKPNCDECVFARTCVANQQSLQNILPIKIRKQKVRKRYFTYIIIEYRGKLLMRKRGAGDIWSGLYDFWLVENGKEKKSDAVVAEIKELEKAEIQSESKLYKHILSHQQLLTHFVWIKLTDTTMLKPLIAQHQLKFYTRDEIAHLPKPILLTRFLHESNYLE